MNNPKPSGKNSAPAERAPIASNFIRNIIDDDLAGGKYAARTWGGKPGPAASHAGAPSDPARIRTRFPPEPNGYLHIGHAKSICLNFGLARDYGGVCHMRFDDTNPTKEEQEYVDSILDAVQWLGFDWGPNLYYASDYFEASLPLRRDVHRARPRLRGRPVGRGNARLPRHADRARPGRSPCRDRPPAPRASTCSGACGPASSPTARACCV